MKIATWIILSLINLILLGITLFLQIIGYGTSPKIYADNEGELEGLIDKAIAHYNQTYYLEIGIIGIVLFAVNYFLLKKLSSKPLRAASLLLGVFLVISLGVLLILSNKYKANHY